MCGASLESSTWCCPMPGSQEPPRLPASPGSAKCLALVIHDFVSRSTCMEPLLSRCRNSLPINRTSSSEPACKCPPPWPIRLQQAREHWHESLVDQIGAGDLN